MEQYLFFFVFWTCTNQINMRFSILIILICILFSCKKSSKTDSEAPVIAPPTTPIVTYGTSLKADGPGDTYELLNRVLGGTAYEVPDCIHSQRHISEIYDSDLKTNVFVFSAHVATDNDRCINFDRQRTEIKTYGVSAEKLKANLGESITYRWKFKLDAGFKPSPSFTHLHQIKAGDGDADDPIITLTARYGAANTDKLELIHIGSDGISSKISTVDLNPFKGFWVEVIAQMEFATKGAYKISIKRVSDGLTLMSYENSNIDLWRSSTSFCRPKWGIYRSLANVTYLRDEEIRFADFCIAEGSAICN